MVRSQASAPPSPLPPLLNDIATMLPFPRKAYHALDDSSAPLSSLDLDTSKLLPVKERTHHVWIQGRLAPVKSVSVANLRKPSHANSTLVVPDVPGTPSTSSRGTSPTRSRFSNVTTPNRRRSFDDAAFGGAGYDTEEERRMALRSSCQRRGYGIGGAGNIRRPTDVIHGPTRPKGSNTTSSSPEGADGDNWRHSLRQLLRLSIDPKGKSKA